MPSEQHATYGEAHALSDGGGSGVSVVIVTYRSAAVIAPCLSAIARSAPCQPIEVIVVDNASPDETVAVAAAASPDVTIIQRAHNGGFADGCAAGANAARGRWLLFLNPDTVIAEDAIEALLTCASEHPTAGIIGGRFVHEDGHNDPRSWWGKPSLWSEVCFASTLTTFLAGSRLFDPESPRPWTGDLDETREAPAISGAFMLVKREVWDRLGGFDPKFFLYGEDTDFCLRAAKTGCRPMVTARAVCYHAGGRSSSSTGKLILLFTGKCTLIRRHFPKGLRGIGIVLVQTGVLVRATAGRWSGITSPALGKRPTTSGEDWRALWASRGEWRRGWLASSAKSPDPRPRVATQSRLETSPSQVVVARTEDEVESLREVWEAAGVGDIDSDIDYFLTVVKNVPSIVRPHVVLIRRPGRPALMGIARLERLGVPLSVGYHTLMRPELRAIVVTFGGLIGTAGVDDERVLVGELLRPLSTDEADMLILRNIDTAGTLRDLLVEGVGWLRRSHAQPATRRWVAQVPESLDAFLSSRSAKTRQTLRRQDRKLLREYGDALRLRRFEHPDEMAELCRDMEKVASKTYQRGLDVAYSGSPLDQGLIALGMRRHWFRTWMLYLSDRPVAFWSGTTYAGTFTTRTPGFDPDYAKDSVGRYAMFRMVEDLCAADDITRLDFGHGDAEYKAAFGTVDRIESDVFVVRQGLRPITVNLAATALSLVNGWGRQLGEHTGWGRRLKRAWRNKVASHRG
jgi:GT2 family glycosyltransferase